MFVTINLYQVKALTCSTPPASEKPVFPNKSKSLVERSIERLLDYRNRIEKIFKISDDRFILTLHEELLNQDLKSLVVLDIDDLIVKITDKLQIR